MTPQKARHTLDLMEAGLSLGSGPMSVDSPTIYEARQTPTSLLGQEIPPAAAPKPPAGRLVGDKALYMPTIYPQQEAPPAAACKPVRPLDRLGPLSAIHLTVGPLLLFGPLAWLAFIWFAGEDVELRHSVLVGDWVTKSITICTLVLRTESGLLSGLCTGMLAALALVQAGGVRLVDAATYSIVGAARSDSMLPRLLSAFSSSMARAAFAVLITGLAFALLVTTTAIQFSSLILVSDLAVTQIPGVASSSNTSYRFNCSQDQIFDLPYRRIEGRVGSWYRKPAFYPTYAEYSETPFIQDGVSDTGVTLRAMVPSSAAPTREPVQRFEGSTTVLDTRVTCQRPVLNNVYVQSYYSSNYLNTKGTLQISGQILSSIATPRLYNRTYQGNILSKPQIDIPDNGVWFNCSSSNNASESGPLLSYQWRTSLCQLGSSSGPGPLTYAGGLLPEFYNGTTSNMLSSGPGTAYLVLNITSGLTDDWLQVPGIYTGVAPHSIQEKAEWADLLFAYGRVTLSTTLCYTAFSASILQQSVTMTGAADRSEPLPGYNYGQSVYTFNDIRRQPGQDRQSYSSKDRGILLLERKDSWVDNSTLYGGANYIEMFADGINTTPIPTTSGFAANNTLILYDWLTSGSDDTCVSVPV